MEFIWEDGFEIRTRTEGDEVTISANRAGLVSLANNLLALAADEKGSHFHLDEFNALEEGSCELIIERID